MSVAYKLQCVYIPESIPREQRVSWLRSRNLNPKFGATKIQRVLEGMVQYKQHERDPTKKHIELTVDEELGIVCHYQFKKFKFPNPRTKPAIVENNEVKISDEQDSQPSSQTLSDTGASLDVELPPAEI